MRFQHPQPPCPNCKSTARGYRSCGCQNEWHDQPNLCGSDAACFHHGPNLTCTSADFSECELWKRVPETRQEGKPVRAGLTSDEESEPFFGAGVPSANLGIRELLEDALNGDPRAQDKFCALGDSLLDRIDELTRIGEELAIAMNHPWFGDAAHPLNHGAMSRVSVALMNWYDAKAGE